MQDGWGRSPVSWTAEAFLAVLGGLLFAAILAALLAWLRKPGKRSHMPGAHPVYRDR